MERSVQATEPQCLSGTTFFEESRGQSGLADPGCRAKFLASVRTKATVSTRGTAVRSHRAAQWLHQRESESGLAYAERFRLAFVGRVDGSKREHPTGLFPARNGATNRR